MNLETLDLRRVNHSRPQLQQVRTSKVISGVDVRYGENTPSVESSSSDAATVTRWATPPSQFRTPQRSYENLGDSTEAPLIRASDWEASHQRYNNNMVRFDEQQIRNMETEALRKQTRISDQADDESPPTPNTDDTPFIRFAIDQLTRDEEARREARRAQQLEQGQLPTDSQSSEDYPVERLIADDNRYVPQRPTRAELALIRKHRSTPGPGRLLGLNATQPLSTPPTQEEDRTPIRAPQTSQTFQIPQIPHDDNDVEIFIPTQPPLNTKRYPELRFLPTILRPFSLLALITLCLLMTAAIMFCAIYSNYHEGLYSWNTGVYGVRYFIFGFLPQILGACIFLYVQYLMAAITRIMPYTLMAMEDAEPRTNALFLEAFPRHMLWPRWDGPMMIDIGALCLWLSVFTIPLQGCLFSVILADEHWKWTAVQGIAWTLVAIYISMCMGLVLIGAFFFHRTTGLLWDPRSLADLIALLPRSNSLRDYPGTETMKSKQEIRTKLADRSDRLGYWKTPSPTQGIFYSIGETGAPIRRYTLESGKAERKISSESATHDLEENHPFLHDTATRFRSILWFLRDAFVVLWCVTAFFLLLALIIISFLPSTAIRHGFPPLVAAGPNGSGYSTANFLYSFIPSLIGMILYLLFQPLDMSLRKLQPWAELANPDGSPASKSLLLDYTAAHPIQSSITALRNGHFRVAWFSLTSFLFIILPILAGGIFFPLTTTSNEVRMLPNLPSFYICLAFLIIYFLTLLLLLPNRRAMHLPHPVDCLAEIISFVHSSNILDDAAFSAPRSKTDLVTRLVSTSAYIKGEEARYVLGVGMGRGGKEGLGIERLGRRGGDQVMVMG
ncbi:8501884c-6e9f-4a89-b5c2-cf158ca7afb3 [Sclerotinia trifoliorum]|uniref:8501884c-6e9f-4a89-b5c2-cf158ca7afb3 n=1 Tax=Sclerotinia trifoliorum TaxID=28548 RepID=A0A8H2W145_9HELO|nr:8501884c-6e9f-4a89-b5c2-cf158ca7afb3 [Sclerotinia trifoliorum]